MEPLHIFLGVVFTSKEYNFENKEIDKAFWPLLRPIFKQAMKEKSAYNKSVAKTFRLLTRIPYDEMAELVRHNNGKHISMSKNLFLENGWFQNEFEVIRSQRKENRRLENRARKAVERSKEIP